MAIFMGCVFGYVLVVTCLGPENRAVEMSVGSAFEKDVDEKDVDLEKGGDVQHQENRV
ncbi:hypothetical protein V1522DRAFT_410906 [Lipomyces starkeyi]